MSKQSEESRLFHMEAWNSLLERCEAWKRLSELRGKLLVCYRLGRQPSGKLLDEIAQVRERLGEE